jgi:polyhydroxyalkanoate synthesis repressor PhaR
MKKNIEQPLIIKKYENRRLYNTQTSQYINQDQVAQLVRDGHDVRVIDAANGEDLTRLILAQIVVEDAKTPGSVFPLDVLRQMILASGKATQQNALHYMKAMMDMYQNAYRALPTPINPFEFLQGKGPSADRATGNSQPKTEQPMSAPASQANAGQVDELKRRVEELESMLTKRAARKSPRKAKSRRKS